MMKTLTSLSLFLALTSSAFAQNLVQTRVAARILSVELAGSTNTVGGKPDKTLIEDINTNVKSLMDIKVSYCGVPESKAKFTVVNSGSAIPKELHGDPVTLKESSLYFTYFTTTKANIVLPINCKVYTTNVQLRCDIQRSFSAAGCKFFVNKNFLIGIESYRSGDVLIQGSRY
jgi:hypothetical protein